MAKKATTKKKKSSKKKPLTTAHRRVSWIMSAKDITRMDQKLNGNICRLPMLNWIMFPKFPDDIEPLGEETLNGVNA